MHGTLQTERLRISPLDAADRDAFVAYRRIPEVARWQGWDPDYRHEDADHLLAGQPLDELPAAGGWLQLAIRDAGSGALLGDVGVHRLDEQPDTFELGITVAPDRQRLGIGAEALRAVIRWLFEQHAAHRVVASCDSRNSASQGLLAAVGFRHEGRAVDAEFVKGEWTSVEHYAMLAGDR